ncbi:hypothetical protein [Prosthecobacter sp.]|uniref:hypothetical protein n=1 Tax=Prosthecobacter sp. TaxID=1965333 RepID=UPI0037849ABA
MTPAKIDAWLTSMGKDRQWLADKLGIRMGTLYNGFSKGFSPRSIKAISDIMAAEASAANHFEVNFTAQEFEQIERARKLLGISTRKLFYEEAITGFADEVIAREAQELAESTKATHFPERSNLIAMVAEEPPSGTTADPYRAAAKQFYAENSPASPPSSQGTGTSPSHRRSPAPPAPKRGGS